MGPCSHSAQRRAEGGSTEAGRRRPSSPDSGWLTSSRLSGKCGRILWRRGKCFCLFREKKDTLRILLCPFVSTVPCVSSNNSAPEPSWCLGLMRASPLSLFNQCHCDVNNPCHGLYNPCFQHKAVVYKCHREAWWDAKMMLRATPGPLCSPLSRCVCSAG